MTARGRVITAAVTAFVVTGWLTVGVPLSAAGVAVAVVTGVLVGAIVALGLDDCLRRGVR